MRDRNPPKKPNGAPSRRGRERKRRQGTGTSHQDGTDQHLAAHPARNRPETAPDERGTSSSLKALINAVAEIPTVSSLHRWRPAQQHEHDPRAGLRAAQARCPHRPRSARVATQWWLSHLEQRGWPTISSTTLDGKPPLADDKAWLGMTHLVLKQPKTRPTPGQITDLAAPPQHESGNPHPRFDAPPESELEKYDINFW